MLFMNIIIASTLNSDLGTFLALKSDKISKNYDSSYKWLNNTVNILLDAFFYVLYEQNNCFYHTFKFRHFLSSLKWQIWHNDTTFS